MSKRQGLKLFDQHLEGLGHAGLGDVFALDDGFVGLYAADGIVALYGQDLLQHVAGAVGLQGPHFHFAEALAAELGLAAQGLLGYQRVGAGGTGVNLIVYQVMQLQIVHIAHGDLIVEGIAGASIVELQSCR